MCVVLLSVLTGCQATQAETVPGQLRVVASINVIADLATHVGGTHVTVESVVPLGGDPHTYEPAPSDARLLADADLILRNGLGLEGWLDRLIDATAREQLVVSVAEGLPSRWDDELAAPDPHLWLDPILVSGYVDAIRDALSTVDPNNAPHYYTRAHAFQGKLHELDAWIRERINSVAPDRRKLVTTHDAFSYFGRRYGLEVHGSIWGISTERDPSAEELRRLIDQVRDEQVPAVFIETTVSPRLMERVARDAGVAIGPPLYADSLGPPESSADTYLGMMRRNTEAIVTTLGN